ncbi:uncharacterized protein LOC127723192 [Mytilus californianus]|uniref:uncharacterized protein LOC127723192 n=1 Tax=Mytilus californianus TaxID=6549 RepID=UPI0022459C91|nr:uncharacterized protein LOC127723192 [Mytilus californianus]
MLQIFKHLLESEKWKAWFIKMNNICSHCYGTQCLEQVDLVCKVNEGVSSILNSVKTFGSIEIKTRPINIGFTRAKDSQAQLQVTPRKRPIYDVNLTLHKNITTGGKVVRGCCMSVNEDFFFIDHVINQMMNVIASDGTFKYNMSLHPSCGLDITFVDEKTVAVTSGDSDTKTGIDIIDIHRRSIMKFIKLPGRSFGITRDGNSLFVCVIGLGIYSIDIVKYTISRVISRPLPVLSYVSVLNENIIYTDNKNDSVVCCDRNGSHVWTFKECSILKCPRGITEDNDGNVYVVGEESANIVIISKDGKHHKQILTSVDGLSKPSAIYFDKQNRKLLVANKTKTACLYYVA